MRREINKDPNPAPASAPATEVHPHAENAVPPLIHASDLDLGFEPLARDSSLAEAASIAEAFLSDASASSGEAASDVVVVAENVSNPSDGAAPTVEVVDSGTCPSIVVDERFNQPDELNSQSSVSILANCGPAAASSSGELSSSQISSVSILANCGPVAASSGGELSSSQISNVTNVENLSNVTDSEVRNESENTNNDNVGNVNYYGSVVSLDDSSAGPVDSEMSQASGSHKRPVPESSSEESASSSPSVLKSKGGA